MTNDLVTKALKNAYYSQSPDKNKKLIFYSDLGSQYTSNDLKNLCKEFNITQSFSKKGCPYDNACIESFHSFVKKKKYTEIHTEPSKKLIELSLNILNGGITEKGYTLLLIT